MAAPPIRASTNVEFVPEPLRDGLQHTDRLGGDFRADAVAAQDSDAGLH